MPHSMAARPRSQRKPDRAPADSEHLRHTEDAHEGPAWWEGTGPAARMVAMWKRAVVQAEHQIVRFGCWFAVLDVVTALSGCYAPFLTPVLSLARLGGLA